jgi:hypothetical protein
MMKPLRKQDEMDNTQPKTQQHIIHIVTIRITCTCGGMCYTEEGYGTSSIQRFDEVVWCQECGKRYDVPESVFRTTSLISK